MQAESGLKALTASVVAAAAVPAWFFVRLQNEDFSPRTGVHDFLAAKLGAAAGWVLFLTSNHPHACFMNSTIWTSIVTAWVGKIFV